VSADVVAGLTDHVASLEVTELGEDREAFAPLAGHLDGAVVVGLGESLHGGRALFELRHRLLRHLVADRGVRTLALESDVAATTALDDYVRRGDGDPVTALAELVVWPWKVRELAAVLEWLRSFNEGRPTGDRVRVRGISPNDATRPAERLRGRLDDREGGVPGSDDALATVAAGDLPADDGALEDLLATVRALEGAVEPAGADDRTGLDRRAVAQALAWHRTRSAHDGPHGAGMAHRDRIMADNVLAALEADPGEGVALWAHDSHVKRGTFDDGTVWTDGETMGEQLDDALGGAYRPLGSEVARGTVRAKPAGEGGPPVTFDLGDPLPGSLAAHLDAVGASPAVLDLRAAAGDDRLADWLDGDVATRRVGSVFDPGADDGHHYLETDLPASFDAVLFVAETGPTRALRSG
jgi:erythromycin esterase